MKKIGLFLMLGCFSASLWASGTTSTPPTVDPFAATKTMKCIIVELRAPNLILLEDPKTGVKQPFRLAEGIKLRAKNKSAFDGRRRLTFQDLAIGQQVKVSVLPDRHEIRSLKVLGSTQDNS